MDVNIRAGRLVIAVGVFVVAWASGAEGADEVTVVQGSQAQTEEGDEESESTPAPGDLSAEEVARRIQKFYKQTKDYRAPFKQMYTDKAAGETKTNYGKVYFKKPGKMRWDYYASESRDDRTKTLVSDGDMFWIYELEFQQVFKRCLDESKLPTSLKFLMGQGNLLQDFDRETDPEIQKAALPGRSGGLPGREDDRVRPVREHQRDRFRGGKAQQQPAR